ncbi:hypothetical protein MF406_01130 [Georgenia sp. TF02-10]|uniref:hypothetical protein n=1 Tax=Georgenia sp. TF02-10 TaxID=2917725 RepID=UPI001FA78676|nr:hypothetical protein [Georgenia sp. TF02-10]UNX54932.1 hypothetical protein MF406_01130 [Georgenia sp. TF02-10]
MRRTQSPGDRRKVQVELTAEGRRLVWDVYGPMVRDGQTLLEELGVDEITAMAGLVNKLSQLTEEHIRRVSTRDAERGERVGG